MWYHGDPAHALSSCILGLGRRLQDPMVKYNKGIPVILPVTPVSSDVDGDS